MIDHLKHLRPQNMRILEELERSLKFYQQHQRDIERAVKLSSSIPYSFSEAIQANQKLRNIMKHVVSAGLRNEELGRIHKSWIDINKPAQVSMAQLQSSIKSALSGIASPLTISERLFSRIDFEAFRLAIKPPDPFVANIDKAIRNMSVSYSYLVESIPAIPELTRLPAFTLPGATREVFATGYAMNAISSPEETEIEEDEDEQREVIKAQEEIFGCIALLQEVDPALATPYIGAHEALHDDNIDKARHIIASLRELWGHLLRKIAPDELVIPWVLEEELLHEGKPTKKARILYICRDLNHHPLDDFVVQDTNALVKLVNLFNRLHELEIKLSERQLRALLLRTDSWLMYILQIWEETR